MATLRFFEMLAAACSAVVALPAAATSSVAPASSFLSTTAAGSCPTSRIAYVHVPKAAGVSLFAAFDGTDVPVCNHGTKLSGMGLGHPDQFCQCSKCGARSQVAIAEQTHAWMKHHLFDEQGWGSCAVWAALVREPQAWFYSAVGQWCAGLGGQQHHPACETIDGRFGNVTMLRAWGFFRAKGRFDVAQGHRPGHVKYYFQAPNLQSVMLGGVLDEPDHLVCDLPQRARLLGAMRGLVGGAPPLAADAHANEAHWDRIDEWRAAVPWADVEEFYREDQRLWERVSGAPGGCVLAATRSRLAEVVQMGRLDRATSSV